MLINLLQTRKSLKRTTLICMIFKGFRNSRAVLPCVFYEEKEREFRNPFIVQIQFFIIFSPSSINLNIGKHSRQPESRNFYFFMGAKKTIQPVVPIRPDFAQINGTLLDPQGQFKKEPSFVKINPRKMFKNVSFTQIREIESSLIIITVSSNQVLKVATIQPFPYQNITEIPIRSENLIACKSTHCLFTNIHLQEKKQICRLLGFQVVSTAKRTQRTEVNGQAKTFSGLRSKSNQLIQMMPKNIFTLDFQASKYLKTSIKV